MMTNPPTQMSEKFEQLDGIWLLKEHLYQENTGQKQLWDQIGQNYYGRGQFNRQPPADYRDAIGRPGGLWNELPIEREYNSILEIGCGDGRASIHLSKNRGLDCQQYCGIDISEPQLRRLQVFKTAYDFYPSAQFTLICMPAKELPLPDASVDLVISDAVFMHLTKTDLCFLMKEVRRVLKPGGLLGFRNSFHNRECLGHIIRNFARRFAPNRNPLYSYQHSLSEVYDLFEQSDLNDPENPIQIKPNGQYRLLPHHLGQKKVPFAQTINEWAKANNFKANRSVYSFDVYNW
ncbi:MAG: class I SAM-dependent methyltransferase [Spirulina sp. SIO3F2]|nr:class I SAM-dependent methyltransferase [Spirulina sp. SIO3F2]